MKVILWLPQDHENTSVPHTCLRVFIIRISQSTTQLVAHSIALRIAARTAAMIALSRELSIRLTIRDTSAMSAQISIMTTTATTRLTILHDRHGDNQIDCPHAKPNDNQLAREKPKTSQSHNQINNQTNSRASYLQFSG